MWAIARAQTYVSFAQHRFIYKSVYDITYVYLWVMAWFQRASMCEHLQGRKHEWFRTTWVHIQNYPWYDILTNTCEYMYVYKKVLSVSARKGTDRCELHSLDSYTKVFLIQCMYTCEYNIIQEYLRYNTCILWIYVYKQEVLSVSTCKGTNMWVRTQCLVGRWLKHKRLVFFNGIFRYSCNNITSMMWEYIYMYS